MVTGAAGMLGRDMLSAATDAGLAPIALARAELDITDRAAVDAAMAEHRPDIVVNCAAWTDVDGAEAQEARALAVNGRGAGHVARAARAQGAWTIQVSSDYVFDGAKRSPYLETDPPGPAHPRSADRRHHRQPRKHRHHHDHRRGRRGGGGWWWWWTGSRGRSAGRAWPWPC